MSGFPKKENLVRFAHNWNDGILKYWDIGVAPFGQINACSEKREAWGTIIYLTPSFYLIIPKFHHSIIPVWNMQNGWLEIPYYQQFVEFPRH
jgi:hypothetical protein